MEWIKCSVELPPDGKLVETRFVESQGTTVYKLFRRGFDWFRSSGAKVDYVPTEWRAVKSC